MYNALIRAIDIKEGYSIFFAACTKLWICRDEVGSTIGSDLLSVGTL